VTGAAGQLRGEGGGPATRSPKAAQGVGGGMGDWGGNGGEGVGWEKQGSDTKGAPGGTHGACTTA